MKKFLLAFTFFSFFISSINSQEFISSTYLTTIERDVFAIEYGIIFAQYDVDLYRMNYTTRDLDGESVTASGLVCVPKIDGFSLPLVSYGHGTVSSRYAVPSYLSGEEILPAIYSSMGTISIAADYLGLGDNEGVHPYVHADSEASASYDMMFATETFIESELDLFLNDQLFITGYSQGGHTAMALHRYIETETDMEVTGSLPMSGPYSISDGMKDLLVSQDEYLYVVYLAATAISYHEVYGTIFPNDDITQFFKQPYASIIENLYEDDADLFEVNTELIDSLVANEGGSFPKNMLQDDMLAAILLEDNHPVNVALRDNDVYDWAPNADTRLIYCEADDQVSFENSIIARDKMNENGATQVVAIDVNSMADHGACVTPAATTFVLYLSAFAQLTSANDISEIAFEVFPNPANDGFTIVYDDEIQNVSAELYDMTGTTVKRVQNLRPGNFIDIDLSSGMYILKLRNQEGIAIGTKKVAIF